MLKALLMTGQLIYTLITWYGKYEDERRQLDYNPQSFTMLKFAPEKRFWMANGDVIDLLFFTSLSNVSID